MEEKASYKNWYSIKQLYENKMTDEQKEHARGVSIRVTSDPLFGCYSSQFMNYVISLAYVHDFVEDGICSVEDLCELGFKREDILTITRKKVESYENYLKRIFYGNASQAVQLVKRADMLDHLSLRKTLTPRLREKYDKVAHIFMDGMGDKWILDISDN